MPKFTVFATERVYYAFEVEAETKDQAYQTAHNYPLSFDEATEGDNFQIQSIEENQNA
jgi:hypothetical protein